MSPQERDAYLRKRPGGMPAGARPILIAAIGSFVWFLLLSPMLLAGLGERLLPTPLDSGPATISDCRRDWRTFGRTWSCQAQVTWSQSAPAAETVTSRTNIGHSQAPVERRRIRKGKDVAIDQLRGPTRVVTADFPSKSLGSVGVVVAVNLTVMVLWWGLLGWWAAREVRRP